MNLKPLIVPRSPAHAPEAGLIFPAASSAGVVLHKTGGTEEMASVEFYPVAK